MNTLTFSIVRAARMILEQKAKEEELQDALRFINLPQTQGGIKMGSLRKLAEKNEEAKAAEVAETEKTAEKKEEVQFTLADQVKIGAANFVNYIAAKREAGEEIKVASAKVEIDQDLLQKTATLIVIDHFDLYKEAKIPTDWLKGLIEKIRATAAQSPAVQKTIHPLAANVSIGAPGAAGVFGGKGYLKSIMDAAKAAPGAAGKTVAGLAKKPGVQIGAAGVGGVGAGLGLGELLRSSED